MNWVSRFASDVDLIAQQKFTNPAEHFRNIRKPIVLFYLGDHDPSGRIFNAIYTLVCTSIARAKRRLTGSQFLRHDIEKYNLPPLRVKETDTRSAHSLQNTDRMPLSWTLFHPMSFARESVKLSKAAWTWSYGNAPKKLKLSNAPAFSKLSGNG